MKLTEKHIKAVKKSGLLKGEAARLEGDALYDAVDDALSNDSPDIKEYTLEYSEENQWCILIKGVPGAYILQGTPFNDGDVFDNLEAAEIWVNCNYGEFMVDGEEP